MTDQWYYGRATDISGPVSERELMCLAASGQVLPTDTVWQQGVEDGVPAATVKNLFAVAAPTAVADEPTWQLAGDLFNETDGKGEAPSAAPVETPPANAYAPRPPAKAGRATAGKGAVIVGQDGKTVKYRGKCSICGREDQSWKTIPIPRGIARVSFFCAKCRKRQEAEIHGIC